MQILNGMGVSVVQGSLRSLSHAATMMTESAFCGKECVLVTKRLRLKVACTAQEMDTAISAPEAGLSFNEIERRNNTDAVPSGGTCARGFESAAHQLEISLHQLRNVPTEMQVTSEEAHDDLKRRGEEVTSSSVNITPLLHPRQKKVWRGVRRSRRTPSQPPWTADDFARRAQRILDSLLPESGEDQGLVADVLNSWLGNITRIELGKLIKDLGLRKRPLIALDVFEWMQRQRGRLKPTKHVYCSVIAMLGRAGMLIKAREIFDSWQVKSLESVYLYNSMMGAYVKSGKFKRAWKLYEDLCERGLEADEVTFNTLLSGISRSDMPVKIAETLFAKMKHTGISPGRYTYNTLITTLSKCGHLERAAAVLEEMRSAKETPDLCTFNTVISMYGQAGKYKEAFQVFNMLKGAGLDPDVITYTNIMQMFSQAEDLKAAIGQFYEMQRAGCLPDVMTYSLAVHIYGRAGLLEEAEKVVKDMMEAGFKPSIVTWSSLIQAYGKKGMLENACSSFAEMQRSGCQPDAFLLNVMMTVYKQADLPTHAARLFRRLQSQGIEPDAACFNTLIHAFFECGQREDAKALHEQMLRAGFAPDKLSRRFLNVHSYRRRKQRNALLSHRHHLRRSVCSPSSALAENRDHILLSIVARPLSLPLFLPRRFM